MQTHHASDAEAAKIAFPDSIESGIYRALAEFRILQAEGSGSPNDGYKVNFLTVPIERRERIPMQNSMWKLATLLGVIGVGCLVVMQVQKSLPPGSTPAATGTTASGEPSGAGEPSTSEDPFAGFDAFAANQSEPPVDQFEPAPAAAPAASVTRVAYQGDPNPSATHQAAGDAFSADAFDDFDSGHSTPETPAAATDSSSDADAFEAADGSPAAQPAAAPADDPFADDAAAFGTQPRAAAAAPAQNNDNGMFGAEDDPGSAPLWPTDTDTAHSPPGRLSTGAPQELPPIDDAFGDEPIAIDAAASNPAQPQPEREDPFRTEPVAMDPQPSGRATLAAPVLPPIQSNDFDDAPATTHSQPAADAFEAMPPRDEQPAATGPDENPWAAEPPAAADIPRSTQPTTPGAPTSEPARINVPTTSMYDDVPGETPGIRVTGGPGMTMKSLDSVPHGTLRPQLRIEKTAPSRAAIGKPLIYSILIRNVGNAIAHDVVVEDQIPRGVKLTGTIPRAELVNGTLIWRFDQLDPEKEQEIRIRVVPEREGELGSVATVNFKAEIGARTTITAPRLQFTLDGQKEAKIGETVVLRYRVENVGTGDATNVWIRNPLPQELQHPEGNDLEYEIGDLPAGASKNITLELVAAGPGQVHNTAVVTADGGVTTGAEADISIIGAQLKVTRRGPTRRYIGRPAVYENVVTNTTHRDAENATLVEHIPAGMKFVKATDGGQYNELKRTVAWAIPQVRAGENVSFKVQLMPTEAGNQESIVQIIEQAGFESRASSVTNIMHLNNMGLQLSELAGPVAVGEKMVFTINVLNRGTSPATRAVLTIDVPPQLRVLDAGPLQANMVGNAVEFEAIKEIAPAGTQQFQISFEALQTVQNARLRAAIQTDQMPKQLITEESVTIYNDSDE